MNLYDIIVLVILIVALTGAGMIAGVAVYTKKFKVVLYVTVFLVLLAVTATHVVRAYKFDDIDMQNDLEQTFSSNGMDTFSETEGK